MSISTINQSAPSEIQQSAEDTSLSLLPGLQGRIFYGFNAATGNFSNQAVFNDTNMSSIVYPYNGETYQCPAQFKYQTLSKSIQESTTTLVRNQAEYDTQFSASVKMEYSNVSFSGSASSKIMYRGGLFSNKSYSYALNFDRQSVYTISLIDISEPGLDANFEASLNGLPETFNAETQSTFFNFFNTYGTHFMNDVYFGGYMTMETAFLSTLMQTNTKASIEASLQGGYNGVINSGEMNSSAAYTHSSFLSDNESNTSVSFVTMGGTYNPDISTYFKSVPQLPLPMIGIPDFVSDFKALSHFIDTSTPEGQNRQKAMEEAIINYTARDEVEDGLIIPGNFNETAALNFDQIYAIQADGFLIGNISWNQKDKAHGYLQVSSGTESNQEMVACASQHRKSGDSSRVTYNSLITPVKKGDYCSATETIFNKAISYASLTSMTESQNDRTGFFGERRTIDLNTSYTLDSDGFVVAYIDYNNNVSRGSIQGIQQYQTDDTVRYVADSMDYYTKSNETYVPYASLCMPVLKGNLCRINSYVDKGTFLTKAFWFPLKQSIFSQFESRQTGITYTAQTDGFLFGYLNANSKGNNRARMRAYVSYDSREILTNNVARSLASVHYNSSGNTHLEYASITVPIAKGESYQIVLDNMVGDVTSYLTWVALDNLSQIT